MSKASAARAEALDSVPSTHAPHNLTPVPGALKTFLTSTGTRHAHGVHIHVAKHNPPKPPHLKCLECPHPYRGKVRRRVYPYDTDVDSLPCYDHMTR